MIEQLTNSDLIEKLLKSNTEVMTTLNEDVAKAINEVNFVSGQFSLIESQVSMIRATTTKMDRASMMAEIETKEQEAAALRQGSTLTNEVMTHRNDLARTLTGTHSELNRIDGQINLLTAQYTDLYNGKCPYCKQAMPDYLAKLTKSTTI